MEDLKKLKEAILFVSKHCEDKYYFGATHLNKILFWADFLHFKRTGQSITGDTYWRIENGPAPKSFKQAQGELLAEGRLSYIEKTIAKDRTQKRPVVHRSIDESLFSDFQLFLLKNKSDELCKNPAAQVVRDSYVLGVKYTKLHDDIPYYTVHTLQINPITDSTCKWAETVAQKLKIA